MKPRKWSKIQLAEAVAKSTSIRQVLTHLGLKEAGGNYQQIRKYIGEYKISAAHFTGKGWAKGKVFPLKPRITLEQILVEESNFQSYKLKRRLLLQGLKKEECEECGWSKKAIDGRVPLEIHHLNGNPRDNRIENLIILCPNCHSLKDNHRGKNKKRG